MLLQRKKGPPRAKTTASREPARSGARPDRWLVVGLGNPGERYARNRHNAGAMAIDELASRVGGSLKRHKSGSLAAEGKLSGHPVVLARPASFMNDSGRPVGALLRFYKSPAERLIVVHDELDIPFGRIRVKAGGGTAGHNGLSSLLAHIGTPHFVRVRIGISRPRGGRDAVGYVLADFSPAERKELPDILGRAADAVERIIEGGPETAMNEFNPD
ncbi:MAG: aminoacyl-tRNA hydrolase [Actinobacteria bacterium]|nr:aminoacyl-tRNA hydrolase [Actinomycetota bacterium]